MCWAALRLEIAKNLGLLHKDEYKFLWITEFPLLEWSEEQNRFVAMHHPFTMPMEEDLASIWTPIRALCVRKLTILSSTAPRSAAAASESTRTISSPRCSRCWASPRSRHRTSSVSCLDAFKYGVPPHAGLAYGLDRLIMLMAKEDSIREVIAFPKVKDASCLMSGAPDVVDPKQLAELDIAVIEKKQDEKKTEE